MIPLLTPSQVLGVIEEVFSQEATEQLAALEAQAAAQAAQAADAGEQKVADAGRAAAEAAAAAPAPTEPPAAGGEAQQAAGRQRGKAAGGSAAARLAEEKVAAIQAAMADQAGEAVASDFVQVCVFLLFFAAMSRGRSIRPACLLWLISAPCVVCYRPHQADAKRLCRARRSLPAPARPTHPAHYAACAALRRRTVVLGPRLQSRPNTPSLAALAQGGKKVAPEAPAQRAQPAEPAEPTEPAEPSPGKLSGTCLPCGPL